MTTTFIKASKNLRGPRLPDHTNVLTTPEAAVLSGLVVLVTILGEARRFTPSISAPLLLSAVVALAVVPLLRYLRAANNSAGAIHDLLSPKRFGPDLHAGTSMAWAVLGIAVLGLAQQFNPSAPVIARAAGALALLSAAIWFDVGSSGKDLPTAVLFVAMIASVAGATFALGEAAFGIPSWSINALNSERDSYEALDVLGFIRPLGPFSSAIELAHFSLVGVLLWLGRWRWYSFLIAALCATGVLVSGSRTALLTGALAVVILLIHRFAKRISTAGFLLLACISVYFASVALVSVPTPQYGTYPNVLAATLARVASGVFDPDNKSSSTSAIHASFYSTGLNLAYENPLGYGVSVLGWPSRLGAPVASSESDFTDIALAVGWLGGIFFLLIVALYAYIVIRYWASWTTGEMAIALIPLACFNFWAASGEYAVYPIIWLCLGQTVSMAKKLSHAPDTPT